jgi:hypothetical protein
MKASTSAGLTCPPSHFFVEKHNRLGVVYLITLSHW